MIVVEDGCVDCGLPCIYEACPHYKVLRYYCDKCGETVVSKDAVCTCPKCGATITSVKCDKCSAEKDELIEQMYKSEKIL